MNGRARRTAPAHGAKAVPKGDRKEQRKAMPVKGPARPVAKGIINRFQSRRERKLALQQDVDKLKKKLQQEENVHRALERAFTRPLGALPRLPPYLPSQTLALLAEVAVLEEEVVRLEEQVVNFRQGIYQEAIIFSTSSTKNTHLPDGGGAEGCVPAQLLPSSPTPQNSVFSPALPTSEPRAPARPSPNVKQTPRKPVLGSANQDDSPGSGAGKENKSCGISRLSRSAKVTKSSVPAAAALPEKRRAAQQTISAAPDRKATADAASNNPGKVYQEAPNRLSEELLSCLLTIFSQMGSSPSAAPALSGRDEEQQQALSPSVSGSSEDAYPQDPYGILELGGRDVGPYRRFHVIDASSFDRNALANNTLLARRLKALLRKLASVDLAGLSHQQKLAFWINVYNSCMMIAFLEQGIPTTPHMLVAMMPKAAIEVGGRTHSAMSIEHFVLRLPYSVKHVSAEGTKGGDDATARAGTFGLEWPEPLVTFALSCGSWSSPAVRVYTAARVDEELEVAKREYLQAAVAVSSPDRLAIPKLLHWYLLDFAKDVDSLMDWICLQLPCALRQGAMRAVEEGRRHTVDGRRIQVLPYEFRFRYLLAS